MSWMNNAIMYLGGVKVSDHGRGPLSESTERFGTDKRMADGTLRRQHIVVKRSWNISWENLPSTNTAIGGIKTVDGGMSGRQLETLYHNTNGSLVMVLRRGSAINKVTPTVLPSAMPFENDDFYITNVMLTDFSKEVVKRGAADLWNASLTLEEV